MTARVQKARRVIILGALSTIAEFLARRIAAEGGELVLAGRSKQRLDELASDLIARGAAIAKPWPIDLAASFDTNIELSAMAGVLGGPVDSVVVIYGFLGDQVEGQKDRSARDAILTVNFTSAAHWCSSAANLLERQLSGVLITISSVAADRGRQSNYLYGAAKAGLTVLTEGIAHRLAPSGARAVAVKLGFVDTAMTAHIKKSGPLWAMPDAVAKQLVGLIDTQSRPVVYMPWFWYMIMSVIRLVPSFIFHKTKL